MLKNPIPKVTSKLQYRAIGIVNGKFVPHDIEKLNRGFLTDNNGEKIETVVLGKALSILKNHYGNHSVDRDPRCLQHVNASFEYFYSLDKLSNSNFSLNQYAFLKVIMLYLVLLFQFFRLFRRLKSLCLIAH